MEEMLWAPDFDRRIKNIPGQGWRDYSLEHVKGTTLEKYGTDRRNRQFSFSI